METLEKNNLDNSAFLCGYAFFTARARATCHPPVSLNASPSPSIQGTNNMAGGRRRLMVYCIWWIFQLYADICAKRDQNNFKVIILKNPYYLFKVIIEDSGIICALMKKKKEPQTRFYLGFTCWFPGIEIILIYIKINFFFFSI